MQAFNLLDEPWLPCMDLRGRPQILSIRETLERAPELAGLHATKPQTTAALYAFLIAFVGSVYRPQSGNDLAKLLNRRSFDPSALHDYASRWRERFYLIDASRPFYQTLGDEATLGSANPATVLDFGRPYKKENSTFYQTPAALSISFAEATQLLIERQAFDLGGATSKGSAKTTTLYNRAVVLAQGKDLFETLALNMPNTIPDGDIPAWERENPVEQRELSVTGPLQILTAQSRRFLLLPNAECTAVESVHYAPGEWFDPNDVFLRHSTLLMGWEVEETKKGQTNRFVRFLGLRLEDSLWRSVFRLFSTSEGAIRPQGIRNVEMLESIGALAADRYSIAAYGIENDNKKMVFQQGSSMSFGHQYFDAPEEIREQLVLRLKETAETAGEIRSKLGKALGTVRKALSKEAPRTIADAVPLYLSSMADLYPKRVIDRLPTDIAEIDGVPEVGSSTVLDFKREAFDAAIKAYEKALGYLARDPQFVGAYCLGLAELKKSRSFFIPVVKESSHADAA